jgi:hypothetical protein
MTIADNENDEVGGIRRWLDENGYPFELEVGAVLADAGWTVRHAQPFLDPDTSKVREIDVTAHIASLSPLHTVDAAAGPRANPLSFDRVDVMLAIECKGKGKGRKAWLTFHSPHDPYTHWFIRRFPEGLADAVGAYSVVLGRRLVGLYNLTPQLIAHGVTVAFTGEKGADLKDSDKERPSLAYGALQSALSAAMHFASRDAAEAMKAESGIATLRVVVPVVVIESPLYACSLSEKREIQLRATPWTCIRTPSRKGGARPYAVLLIQRAALDEFARDLAKRAQEVCRALVPDSKAILAHYRANAAAVSDTIIVPDDDEAMRQLSAALSGVNSAEKSQGVSPASG